MKTKKILPLLATLIIGTSAALSGCGGNTKIIFKNNWLKDPLNPQASLSETLSYDVTFEKNAGMNTISYAFDYQNGKFVSTLTQRSDGQFEYTTKLTIDVVYTLGGESQTKQDEVTTYVHFENANNGLKPIKSSKTILSHTPRNITGEVVKIDTCYEKAHYSMETNYADGKGVCVLQNLIIPQGADKVSEPEIYNFEMGEKVSYLDNEQLLIGLRAFDSSTSSGKISAYSPFVHAKQTVSVSFNSDKASTELTVSENGQESVKKPYTYRAATMKLNQGNSGAEQTAWVALGNRNMILRLETPLPFMFGSLIYTLKTIDRIEN